MGKHCDAIEPDAKLRCQRQAGHGNEHRANGLVWGNPLQPKAARHTYTGEVEITIQPADVINHPPHYTGHPSGVECITITRHMNFNVGNAVKYLWRAGLKGATVEDLRKAAWYIADEIKRLETAKG